MGGAPPGTSARARTWPLVLLLLVLAPVCAEYLTAYDPEVTGQPARLIFGLVVLVPLYGGPALLIREVAARTGMRWTGILALAGAFGVVQSGVVDQSLFASHFMAYDDWAQQRAPTLLAPLGVSGAHALNFLVGHLVWSIAAPVALVEALDRRPGRQPWLRPWGAVVLVVLWAWAALFVWRDVRATGSSPASTGQLVAAAAAVTLLVVAATTVGRRAPPARAGHAVPPPAVVLPVAAVAAFALGVVPSTWTGVVAGAALLVTAAALVTAASRSAGWTGQHVAAVAGGVVVARAVGGLVVVATADPRPPGGLAQTLVQIVLVTLVVVPAVRGRAHGGLQDDGAVPEAVAATRRPPTVRRGPRSPDVPPGRRGTPAD